MRDGRSKERRLVWIRGHLTLNLSFLNQLVDGYNVQFVLCTVAGIIWLVVLSRRVIHLQVSDKRGLCSSPLRCGALHVFSMPTCPRETSPRSSHSGIRRGTLRPGKRSRQGSRA